MGLQLAKTQSTAWRQISALAAIALWLTSAWAWAACCCDTLPTRAGGAQNATADTGWHPEPGAHAHADEHGSEAHAGAHPHDNAPAEDCESLASLPPPLVAKAAVPPPRAGHDFIAIPTVVSLVFLPQPAEGRGRRSLPPPPFLQVNPFLSTIRLLL